MTVELYNRLASGVAFVLGLQVVVILLLILLVYYVVLLVHRTGK